MDFYQQGNWIYWVDYEEDQNNGIFRVRPDGSDRQQIIKVWMQSDPDNSMIILYYRMVLGRVVSGASLSTGQHKTSTSQTCFPMKLLLR